MEYYMAFYKRFENGEYMNRDSIDLPDSLRYSTLRLKRTVYGGGGIMPDIFMPADTSYYSPFYKDVLRKGVITEFVNEYTDNERENLRGKYGSLDSFMEKFTVDEQLWENFVSYAISNECTYEPERDSVSRDKLSEFLKGLIIRNLYDMNSYFVFINGNDVEVRKALEVIKSGNLFALSDSQ